MVNVNCRVNFITSFEDHGDEEINGKERDRFLIREYSMRFYSYLCPVEESGERKYNSPYDEIRS